MFCPRCGNPNTEGPAYCSSCGSRLSEPGAEVPPASERRSVSERAAALVGSTRRERLISAATGVAIVVAIVAVVVLATDGILGGDDAEDTYLDQADRICVERVGALGVLSEELSGSRRDPGAVAGYGAAGAEVVAGWRSQLSGLDTPSDLEQAADRFDQRIQALEAELTTLAQGARTAGSRGVERLTGRVASAGARTESEIGALGLEECARLDFGVTV